MNTYESNFPEFLLNADNVDKSVLMTLFRY